MNNTFEAALTTCCWRVRIRHTQFLHRAIAGTCTSPRPQQQALSPIQQPRFSQWLHCMAKPGLKDVTSFRGAASIFTSGPVSRCLLRPWWAYIRRLWHCPGTQLYAHLLHCIYCWYWKICSHLLYRVYQVVTAPTYSNSSWLEQTGQIHSNLSLHLWV